MTVQPAASGKFTLFVQNEDLATWMAINNNFAFTRADYLPANDYWNGMLIQVGKYDAVGGGAVDRLEQIVLKHDSQPDTVISRDTFKNESVWINIVCGEDTGPRRPPVMAAELLGPAGLFPLDPYSKNTLHNYFTPYGLGITMWQDYKTGLQVTTSQTGTYGHNQYTFSCERIPSLKVEVYYKNALKETYTDVHTVVVEDKDNGGGGGGHKSPPFRP
jgi:hypothetical protein